MTETIKRAIEMQCAMENTSEDIAYWAAYIDGARAQLHECAYHVANGESIMVMEGYVHES